ncbi:MAG: TetR/AcrR family transcriptional regulator [Chloroflexia bacterium]|nr:TetR/AcrR family transcriptional regulator [Chloroflexia bacterium]
MGRKSIAEARRAEILAAFERCIGRYGIDVALDRIAEEAGVQRSLIRHYLGNRDDVVMQLVVRIAEEYPRKVAAQMDLAVERGGAGILEVFFGHDMIKPTDVEALNAVLNAPPERYPQARDLVAQACEAIVTQATAGLARLYPQAPQAHCRAVAYSLFCMAMAHDDFRWLGLDDRYNEMVREQAAQLINALGG